MNNLNSLRVPKLSQSTTAIAQKTVNFATGWYVAMSSKALQKKPKPIQLFDRQLIAWRDQKSCPSVMELYCSHMGASLAKGKVVDDCIRCPYHGWHYNRFGECVFAPESDTIPPTALQSAYTTVERYGYIWVWYGSPTPLYPLPQFPEGEIDSHHYLSYRQDYSVKTTALRVQENLFDVLHFFSTHNLKVSGSFTYNLLRDDEYLTPDSQPPIPKEAWIGLCSEFHIDVNNDLGKVGSVFKALGLYPENVRVRIDSWSSGAKMTVFHEGITRCAVLVGFTPITANETQIWMLTQIKKKNNVLRNILEFLFYVLQTEYTMGQDLEILNTINPDGGGAYINYDQPPLKMREFYQSWVGKVS
ncbi:MAG: Rieske 2Fe-2S domain-containing protein [Limnoraphis sp.]